MACCYFLEACSFLMSDREGDRWERRWAGTGRSRERESVTRKYCVRKDLLKIKGEKEKISVTGKVTQLTDLVQLRIDDSLRPLQFLKGRGCLGLCTGTTVLAQRRLELPDKGMLCAPICSMNLLLIIGAVVETCLHTELILFPVKILFFRHLITIKEVFSPV